MHERAVAEDYAYENLDPNERWVPLSLRPSLSLFRILAICSSMLSFQVAYSVEFSLATPIMKTLNLSNALTGIVWWSGPISGFVVQPLIGYYSDGLQAKLGRRRPFIIGGSLGILAGFALFVIVQQSLIDSIRIKQGLVVAAMILTNVAINVLQGPARALVGDVVPMSQQMKGNTIGTWLLGLAAVVTNLIGGLPVVDWLGLGGKITADQLTFYFGALLIVIGVTASVAAATEEPLRKAVERANPFVELYHTFRTTPRSVYLVCIQYCLSWLAYFPFQTEVTDFFGVDVYHGTSGDDTYRRGYHFGMCVTAVMGGLVLVYSIEHDRACKRFGLRVVYAVSQAIEGAMLVAIVPIVLCVKDGMVSRWILMAALAPLGISFTIFNSLPFAIVSLIVSKEALGLCMGMLNTFAVAGQQIASVMFMTGIGSIHAFERHRVAIVAGGSIFAVAGVIMAFYLPDPTRNDELATVDPNTNLAAAPLRSAPSYDCQ